MTKSLWAPWRVEYVGNASEQKGCVFCSAQKAADDDALVVHRSTSAFALLNRFPYSSGHLMVAPYRHVGALGELTGEEIGDMHELVVRSLEVLAAEYRPDGFNLGWNLGQAAGAGVVDHVHEHVVPRWLGDTNFMPVLADVRVVPEHLERSRERLVAAWTK